MFLVEIKITHQTVDNKTHTQTKRPLDPLYRWAEGRVLQQNTCIPQGNCCPLPFHSGGRVVYQNYGRAYIVRTDQKSGVFWANRESWHVCKWRSCSHDMNTSYAIVDSSANFYRLGFLRCTDIAQCKSRNFLPLWKCSCWWQDSFVQRPDQQPSATATRLRRWSSGRSKNSKSQTAAEALKLHVLFFKSFSLDPIIQPWTPRPAQVDTCWVTR